MKRLIIYRSTADVFEFVFEGLTHSIIFYIIIALRNFDLKLDESRFINIGEFIPGH